MQSVQTKLFVFGKMPTRARSRRAAAAAKLTPFELMDLIEAEMHAPLSPTTPRTSSTSAPTTAAPRVRPPTPMPRRPQGAHNHGFQATAGDGFEADEAVSARNPANSLGSIVMEPTSARSAVLQGLSRTRASMRDVPTRTRSSTRAPTPRPRGLGRSPSEPRATVRSIVFSLLGLSLRNALSRFFNNRFALDGPVGAPISSGVAPPGVAVGRPRPPATQDQVHFWSAAGIRGAFIGGGIMLQGLFHLIVGPGSLDVAEPPRADGPAVARTGTGIIDSRCPPVIFK